MKSLNNVLYKKKGAAGLRRCALLVSFVLLACACAPSEAQSETPVPTHTDRPLSQPSATRLATSSRTPAPATPTTEASSTPPLATRTKTPAAPLAPGTTPTRTALPGSGASTVGFIYAGWRDDLGYDGAVYAGIRELAREFSGRLDILENENTDAQAAGQVMEKMIQDGARIIFSTDPVFEDTTLQLAERHPQVTFLQLGGTKPASNLGAPSGSTWEAMYLSGVAAGKVTQNNRLGFVAAPLPRMLLDVNAFTLGARSVNPAATVYVAFTRSGCNFVEQQEGIFTLLDLGTDVVAQNQNCTQTIIEICERNSVKSVGYHQDGSAFAPKHWLTGMVWNWGPLYIDITGALQAGQWNAGPYNGRYQAGLKEGLVGLAPFGSWVPTQVQTLVLARRQAIIDGTLHPFQGPVKDQDGHLRIPAGVRPSLEELESIDYLVEGTMGSLP